MYFRILHRDQPENTVPVERWMNRGPLECHLIEGPVTSLAQMYISPLFPSWALQCLPSKSRLEALTRKQGPVTVEEAATLVPEPIYGLPRVRVYGFYVDVLTLE